MTAAPENFPAAGDLWELPSGRVVNVKRIEGTFGAMECAVQYVDDEGRRSRVEFSLSAAFLARCRKLGNERWRP